MTLYNIHQRSPTEFSVHKLNEDYEHLDTYDMILNPHHEVCKCPAWKTPCKHIKMVKAWLEMDPKERVRLVFNDRTGEFQPNKLFEEMVEEEPVRDAYLDGIMKRNGDKQ